MSQCWSDYVLLFNVFFAELTNVLPQQLRTNICTSHSSRGTLAHLTNIYLDICLGLIFQKEGTHVPS